jgi:nanoRNase/pAp phosphatase (c-di-AMP/oligoRNAs hydrolase)
MDVLNQAKNLIEKSRNILLLPSLNSAGDSLGAAFALFFTLKKLGKNVNVVAEEIPEKFHFLSELNSLPSKDFIISINTSEKDITEMRYEKNEKDLKIRLTLNRGEVGEKDVSFSPLEEKVEIKKGGLSEESPDLLITLGTSSLEDLREIFFQNSGVFYETPILNIDNHPSNENFGEVNLIEVTSSVSETVTNLINSMERERGELLGSNIASYLLTGIIWSSQNFRNPKTRPKTFETSAFLIERGACHQKIIQQLYKQKEISQIKLLGRILERLNFDKTKGLYSASLTEKDFQECQASSKDLSFVLEEMKFNFRYLPNLLILWESHASPTLIKGVLYSPHPDLLQKVLENFEGISKGEGVLFLIREKELALAEEKVFKIL